MSSQNPFFGRNARVVTSFPFDEEARWGGVCEGGPYLAMEGMGFCSMPVFTFFLLFSILNFVCFCFYKFFYTFLLILYFVK